MTQVDTRGDEIQKQINDNFIYADKNNLFYSI